MSQQISVLEQKYSEPERPYSQKELQYMRNSTYRSMRIGSIRAEHNKCRHFYLVKDNGRKEKQIVEQKNNDTGNCSVCWKISKSPRHLKQNALNLVNVYCKIFFEEPKYLTYQDIDTETAFYKWLYQDFM